MSYHKLKESENIILFQFGTVEKQITELPPSLYLLSDAGKNGMEIPQFTPATGGDELIEFTDGIMEDITSEIKSFFSKKSVESYAEMKLMHKVGFIVYGSHGTGKTCLCRIVMNALAEQYGCICLDCTNVQIGFTIKVLTQIREIQKNPIVVFIDECEVDLVQRENKFLSFLDGNNSISDMLFIGCTNFIDKIPDRIKDRKSRIKKCFEIKGLPTSVYSKYLSTKLPSLSKDIVNEFSYKATESGLNIDQFKNAVLDYHIYGLGINEAIKDSKKINSASTSKRNDDEGTLSFRLFGGY